MPRSGASSALSRRQALAIAVYFAIVGVLTAGALLLVLDLEARSRDVAAAEVRFDRLIERSPRAPPASITSAANASGSPFLDGRTVTIAGAELQQRVEQAVAKAGGVLSSSQVDLDGQDAAQGFVRLTATAELSQPAIQAVLYDVEAGMPYLFVDNLSIQSPQDLGEPESGKMRMTVGVVGQWFHSE